MTKDMTFTPAHMEQLRRLGMCGYPCATYAANEIRQLNDYAYALECALVFGHSNSDEVRAMIEVMRERFAPDVDFPEVPRWEDTDGEDQAPAPRRGGGAVRHMKRVLRRENANVQHPRRPAHRRATNGTASETNGIPLPGQADCGPCYTCSKLAEVMAEVTALKTRADYLESRHCEWSDPDDLGDGCMLRKDKTVDKLKAERDEWKAKAYGHRSRLDRLYETDAWFRNQLEINYGLTEGYLMAPYDDSENQVITHVDESCRQDAGQGEREEAPDCESGISDNLGQSQDFEISAFTEDSVPETPDFAENPQKTARNAKNDDGLADEPPEGDALAMLRQYADDLRYDYNPLTDTFEPDERLFELCGHAADMVERDYVRREDYVAMGKSLGLAQAECDEWKAKHADQSSTIERMQEVIDGYVEQVTDLETEVDQLDGDLKGARKSRDHWRNAASKHGGEIKRLKHELAQARKYGEIWPEFEGGGKVEIGNSMMYDEKAERVQGIRFYDTAVVYEFTGVDHCRTTHGFGYGQLVDRPPLKAHDGREIRIGETLYGLSDGKAWTVTAVNHGEKHAIVAENRDGEPMEVIVRALRPEWLTHEAPEPPDSWERVAFDLRMASYHGCNDEDLAAMARRLDKLAKEGA